MIKLTKEQFEAALKKPILSCEENEIRFAFHVMGFDLKEYRQELGRIAFEIHYQRVFIIKVEVSGGVVVFSNPWIVFNDREEVHHINMDEPQALILILNMFVTMFNEALLKPMEYKPAYIKEWSIFDDGAEAKEAWATLQLVIQELLPKPEPDKEAESPKPICS